MKDIDFLLNHIKEQIDRASRQIEINIILNDYYKKILLDNWDYISTEITNYAECSNTIFYKLKRDKEGKNILTISF